MRVLLALACLGLGVYALPLGPQADDSNLIASVSASSSPPPPPSPAPPCVLDAAPSGALMASASTVDLSLVRLQTDLAKCDLAKGVRQIGGSELAGLSYSKFYTSSADKALVFKVDVGGVTTKGNDGRTGYPRTELRELTPTGAMAAWSPQGRHTLTVRESIHKFPAGKESTIVAQVKSNISPVKAYPFLKMKATVKGSTAPQFVLEARVKYNTADGSVGEKGLKFDRRFSLGEQFDIQIVVTGLLVTVSVNAVGEAPQTVTHDYAAVTPFNTVPSEELYYFKAGNYCQSNLKHSPAGEQCEVHMQSFAITHA